MFISIAILISYIDIKQGLIPDRIIIPAILALIVFKIIDNSLCVNDLIAVVIVSIIFIIPIALNMAFGGGDIRFGVFCALFLGLAQIGLFIMLSGLIHLLILFLVKQKSFAFAPAMSLSALIAYTIGVL